MVAYVPVMWLWSMKTSCRPLEGGVATRVGATVALATSGKGGAVIGDKLCLFFKIFVSIIPV